MAHGQVHNGGPGAPYEEGSGSEDSYEAGDGARSLRAIQDRYDKRSAGTTAHEDDPLLPPVTGEVPHSTGSQTGSQSPSRWQGESDFEGLPWWKKPSIYWLLGPFFLYTLAFGGTVVPRLDLVLSLVCRENLERQASGDRLSFTPVIPFDNNLQCRTPAISAAATTFTLYMSLISGGLAVIASPKLGALSDRYGRKRLIGATTAGGILAELVTIAVAIYPNSLNYRWLLLGSMFEGLCGSFIAGMALTHSYASDCTSPAQRAVAFGYFHACLFGGIALGPLLAGLIIKATGTVITIFIIAIVCHSIFLLFIVLLIPESLTLKRQLAARERHQLEKTKIVESGVAYSWAQTLNILEPLKILYPTGEGSSSQVRTNLMLLSAVDTIIFGTAMGAMAVTIYYSKLQFSWDAYDSNMFIAILNSCRVSGLVFLLPALNYIFRTRHRNRVFRESGVEAEEKQSGSDQLDLYIIRFSVFLEMLGFIGYACARTGPLFTVSGMFAAVGGMGSPTLQSSLTKHVPHDRVGQLLGATGLLHALARIVCPTVFSLVYAGTVATLPQTVFVLLAACFLLAFMVSWFVRPHVYLEDIGVATANQAGNRTLNPTQIMDEEVVGI